jgi:type IV pilus assembly protein PilE
MKPPSSPTSACGVLAAGRPPAARQSRFRGGKLDQAIAGGDGFTLIEVLIVCAVLGVLATLAMPSLRGHDYRAGRLDGVNALTRVQQAQEQYRSAHGLYAGELAALIGAARRSPQGRYEINLALNGGDAYLATAKAVGPQADDPGCGTLTLQVRQGFAQVGPHAGCWLR